MKKKVDIVTLIQSLKSPLSARVASWSQPFNVFIKIKTLLFLSKFRGFFLTYIFIKNRKNKD